MKQFRFLLAFTLAALVLNSCAKEELVSTTSDGYPAEMTIDNWEEFVYAPDEVLEKFILEERKMIKHSQVEVNQEFDANRLILGPMLLGKVTVKGQNFAQNQYLGGTGVTLNQIGSGAGTISTPQPFYMGQNWVLSNLESGTLCFYHQNNQSGTYSYGEWVNGVSTRDLVVIAKHILNTLPFTELWQYVAADADGDGTVSWDDITLLESLILGGIVSLPPMAQGFYNQLVAYFPLDEYDAVDADLSSYLGFLHFFYPTFACKALTADSDRYAIKRGDLTGNWSF